MIRKGATAIATFDLCPRKWAFSAASFSVGEDDSYRWLAEGEGVGPGLIALPAPPSPWQAVGTAVHKSLENYLTGVPLRPAFTEADAIAMAGIHHLPLPSPRLWVERPWRKTLGRHLVTGQFDLVDPGVRLYDHKTTGDFQWAKSADDLREDTQAILYTWALGASKHAAQWTYFRRTKPYASLPVDFTVHVRDERLRMFERTLDAMQAAEGCDPLRDLPAVPSACSAFGGCPYQSRCKLTLGQRINPTMLHTAESIREQWAKEYEMTNIQAMKQAMQGINPPREAAQPPDGKTPISPYSPDARHNDDRTLWLDEGLWKMALPGVNPWFPVPAKLPPPPPDDLPPPPPAYANALEATNAQPRMTEERRAEIVAGPAAPKRGRPRKITASPAALAASVLTAVAPYTPPAEPPADGSDMFGPPVAVTEAAANTLRAASVATVLRAIADLLES